MNRANDLVPSDYSLIYSRVVKYQSVLLDKRITKSIHCLVNLDDSDSTKQTNNLIKSNSSHLNQSSDCNCGAIHFSSALKEKSSKFQNNHSNKSQNSSEFLTENASINQKLNYSSLLNQQKLDFTKTASTNTVNSKLKGSSNRLTSATGHRMPNSNLVNNKNATNPNQHSSTNKSNENAQSTVNQPNKQQASTNQAKRITDQAIQLLAEDVESRLEALLRTFIQEEKLRQEARYNSLMGKRSASLNALNSDYTDAVNQEGTDYSSISRYNQQLNKSNLVSNKATGYVKPQQHRMQQSYQLHNSQNVNTPQQKLTGIKTSSHRLDSSPSRSSAQSNSPPNSKVSTSRTRSPSPNSRQSSSPQPSSTNLFPVNRNNLFGQHQRANQTSNQATSSNKQPTTYLNLHQRSQSPTKDNQPIKSSQLVKQQQQMQNNQSIGHSSHRLYPNQIKFYDPFSTNSSQFGRSKDDSHIRRVVVYNLSKDAASVEKKPVIIEGSKSGGMNGTLNNGYVQQATKSATANVASTGEKIGITNDNQAIRLRSAKTRTNSPSRVGSLLNGNNIVGTNSAIGQNSLQSNNTLKQQPTNNSLATGRTSALSSACPANTNKLLTTSSLNNASNTTKKLSSTGKVTNTNSNRLTTGHESSLQQFKDHNNLDSTNVGVGTAAQQLSTERKVVRKLIVKELDAPRNESVVNSSNLINKPKTYQQQRLSPISNGDLNNVVTMATLNAQQQPMVSNNLTNQVSSLDALLSERDRILNNRDQYKQLRNNVLSDANNNYILSKSNSNKFNTSNSDLSSSSSNNSSSSVSAAGLQHNSTNLNNLNQSTNRNLPLSSSAAKRKPLIDRYSPFSIVNEARQRWEETVKNGMNGQLASRFNCLDNKEDCLNDLNDLIFNETYEQSDEEFVDSSMVLIRSRLNRMLNTNGNVVPNLPNSAIFSLLNHLSNNKIENESIPACFADLNQNEILLNTSHSDTSFSDVSLSSQLNTPNIIQSPTSATAAINSMRPPLVVTTNLFDSNGHSTPTGQSNNGQSSASQNRTNTVKPFLSKGSVAERVMLFEKHPQLKQIEETEAANRKEESAITQRVYKSPLPYSSWRDKNKNEVINLSTSFEQNLKGKPPLSKQQNLQESLPKFYFPHGKPLNNNQHLDQITKQVNQFFKTLKDGICTRDNLIDLCKASNFPIYWKEPLFLMLAQNNQISHDSYLTFWRKLIGNYFNEASKFVFILSKGKRNCLLPEDFIPMIQDVINTHPGLLFLKYAFEFHSRYVHTVIARIYYCIVKLLQDEDDINQITDYFSYEHFYVIYCKFWGLDKDHDLIIDKYDLSRHNDGAISSRMIDRIFSGAVTQSKSKSKQMTYQEFVFFLISEEDKKTDTAIEYWFRCLDLDGDGFLSLYELEWFYEEQVRRMESIGIEALPFADCICQMLDMINPEQTNKISLSDLKKCSMTYIFLDTFFNLHKYLLHEQKDPFSNKDDQLESDWNKFAAEEYNLLVAEEQNQINENEAQTINQQKYMTFVYDDENEFRVNPYLQREYDDYDSTDQEDYDYLIPG